ncbi:MAG TPA: ATP-binding protein, partial [Vicinamibacterales bacterium]|nr:ATP-binding protein [Vicinamibacterales bacterium]
LGLAAAAMWAIAPALVMVLRGPWPPVPLTAAFPVAAAATFALLGVSLRKYYRRTTQAMRLVLVFGAMVMPSIALYPISAFHAERQARHLIESTYAPAVMQHPSALQEQMARAQSEIDRLPNLVTLVSTPPPAGVAVQSQSAFFVWSQTNLSRARATSEIELYGPDRKLVSRFALNVPEYQSPTSLESWQGGACHWDVYSEVRRFGADERLMWHARRSVCDASGRFLGGVVVHVLPDYRSLPFIASASPYREVLASGDDDSTLADVPELAVVVYGWGRSPVFTSSDAAWSVTEELAAQMRASRTPFWRDLPADNREYHVYFTNDRAFVYALGYPSPTWFEHATRLAEIAVTIACVFVVVLLGAMVYAPFTRQHDAPLRVLFREIRTSFYRKLFLFFVLAAIGPVLLLAIAFSAYVSARLEADVKSEAASIVTVARRVFEEISAAQQENQPQALPSDDEMVWIRQVIDQDVNIFQGPALIATSQRDLFDSGLLQTRTPALVYRTIVLDRLPSVVLDDRIGAFQYVVAAAPVPTSGRDIVLSVPLAQRQREIERELDVLNRGMLVASVVVVLFAAGLGASVAGRVSDPVARLTRATRQIAAGRLDVRIVADTADELKRLVDDFNTMTETLVAQRGELARTNQIKAWAEMARQVAHEIKNPLTPIQLASEHLQRVHDDRGRPLGPVFDQCVSTIIRQVRLLRQIASEFSNFAGQPTPRFEAVGLPALVREIVEAYGATPTLAVEMSMADDLPPVRADRTLLARAITNVVENAVQAMPAGGRLRIGAADRDETVELVVTDSGVGMDQAAADRAFEPYFSTKTAGSGLGLPNAKRNIEICGGAIALASAPGRGTTVTITLPVSPRASSAG